MHDLPLHNTLKLNLQLAGAAYSQWILNETNRGVPYRLAADGGCFHYNEVLRKYGDFYMAKPKRPSNTQYGITWVRVDLSEAESTTFEAWESKGAPDLFELLQRMLAEGDKVSLSYSEKADCFYASVMGSEASHRNAGKGFSSYANTPETALALAVFKYWTILEGDMSEGASSERPAFG